MTRTPRPRALAVALGLCLASSLAAAATGASPVGAPVAKESALPLSGTGSWFARTLSVSEVRLQTDSDLDLLRRFSQPWIERPGEWRSFLTGRYGPRVVPEGPRFAWTLTANEPRALGQELPGAAIEALALDPTRLDSTLHLAQADVVPLWKLDLTPSPDPLFLRAATTKRCEPWERPYRATVARYGGEFEEVELLDCDGSVAIDAVDRLSVLARPPGSPRPELPLPLEPEPESQLLGEWVPEVRLLDPRLIWVVARLSAAFPRHVIYVISGYRRDGHGSFHKKGRALDLFVMGARNEDVLRVCRGLKDVGCGFYPNNKFLHVDVRPPGTGHALWIDVSSPGQPSRYVDAWPGVVANGALAWGSGE